MSEIFMLSSSGFIRFCASFIACSPGEQSIGNTKIYTAGSLFCGYLQGEGKLDKIASGAVFFVRLKMPCRGRKYMERFYL